MYLKLYSIQHVGLKHLKSCNSEIKFILFDNPYMVRIIKYKAVKLYMLKYTS